MLTMFSRLRPYLNIRQHENVTQIVRLYAKPLKRRPVKVIRVDLTQGDRRRGKLPDPGASSGPVTDTDTRGQDEVNGLLSHSGKSQEKQYTPTRGPADGDSNEKTIRPSLMYNRIGDSDRRYRQLLQAVKSSRFRENKQLVVLEGQRLIHDAIDAGATFKSIFFDKVEHLDSLQDVISQADTSLYKLSCEQMKIASDVVAPQGLIALAKMPSTSEICIDADELLPITLICDNLRDPGNMGALLRSAAAVGCQKVLLTKGCVDLWEPKVVRASAGCHFRSHILHDVEWPTINNLLPHGSPIYLADTHHSVDPPSANVEMTCPEPGRYSREILNTVTKSVDGSETGYGETPACPTEHGISQGQKNHTEEPRKNQSVKTSKRILSGMLPLVNIYETYFTLEQGQECVLIIGGETEGLSKEAYKSAVERSGQRAYLPMVRGVDSLNAAMAGTAILFEIKRQLLTLKS